MQEAEKSEEKENSKKTASTTYIMEKGEQQKNGRVKK